MAINRASIRKQLQEGLNAVFGLEYGQYPDQWKEFLTLETESKKAFVEDVLMTGLGAAAVKAEGAGVQYDSASEGWVSRYVFETIALAFAITEEAMEDDLYKTLGTKLSKALARSMAHTKNVKGANILNYGFNSSYTGGDGKVLFATDHPLKSGGTQANTLATQADLSETSLEDMLVLISNCVDDRGLPMPLTAKKLIVPTASQFIAARLLSGPSDMRQGTSDRDINAIKTLGLVSGGFSVNNFLTDNDAWYLTTNCADGLKMIQRVALKTGMDGDFDSGNMRYKARERYAAGWSDFRGAFGSQGI